MPPLPQHPEPLPATGPNKKPTDPTPGESPFSGVLKHLGQRLDGGEALIDRATRSDLGGLEAPALIAIQAGIYRYVEAVDLAAKLVDRATNAVRTVLQSNH
jgi:hypothetical protein